MHECENTVDDPKKDPGVQVDTDTKCSVTGDTSLCGAATKNKDLPADL